MVFGGSDAGADTGAESVLLGADPRQTDPQTSSIGVLALVGGRAAVNKGDCGSVKIECIIKRGCHS